jgi:hypothetical protein
MSKKYNSEFHKYNLDYKSYEKFQRLCGNHRYEIENANKFVGILPDSFVSKSSTVLIMEQDVSGSSVFVANFIRRDVKTSGSFIDQHPFISVYDHSGSICKSGFLEHGDWDGRTIQYTDPWLWGMISGSGFLDCLPIEQFPEKPSGDISELNIVSHNEAFNASLRFLEKES